MNANEPLLEYVLKCLDARSGTIPEIAVGADVPYDTVSKIHQRISKNPRVKTVQKLANYFYSLSGEGGGGGDGDEPAQPARPELRAGERRGRTPDRRAGQTA